MSASILTQTRLKELLFYNPTTGIFTWINHPKCPRIIGKPAKNLSHGYITIKIDQVRYHAHRLAFLYMLNTNPEEVDHINHIRHDNRWSNLRAVSHKENHKNRSKCSRNKSGFVGVSWDKTRNKWIVMIRVNNKSKNLGRFTCLGKAIQTRIQANKKYNYHPNHGKL